MATVSERAKKYKQPKGGFIKPSQFSKTIIDDDEVLNDEENIHGSIVGMVVDYMTRYLLGSDILSVFRISINGAEIAQEYFGVKNAMITAFSFLSNIKGLDDKSIINACKLSTFDVWKRNPLSAIYAKTHKDINPDKKTITNIRIMIKRSVSFLEQYGPVIKDGFTFEPKANQKKQLEMFLDKKINVYGGYTSIVSSGDGDFLTLDTMRDFKVMKSGIKSHHVLQLLMYWIMGQHSKQKIFKSIKKIGFYNPRLNIVYELKTSDIPKDVISIIEKDVICYP